MQQSGITKGEQAARVEFGSCCSSVTTLDSKLRTESGSSSYVHVILGSGAIVRIWFARSLRIAQAALSSTKPFVKTAGGAACLLAFGHERDDPE
jgi:hypothetical protein